MAFCFCSNGIPRVAPTYLRNCLMWFFRNRVQAAFVRAFLDRAMECSSLGAWLEDMVKARQRVLGNLSICFRIVSRHAILWLLNLLGRLMSIHAASTGLLFDIVHVAHGAVSFLAYIVRFEMPTDDYAS